MTTRSNLITEVIEPLIMGIILCSLVIPIGIVGYQTFTWLQTGQWVSFPVRWLWHNAQTSPHVSWVGVQAMLDWALDLPISGASVFILVIALCIVVSGSLRVA